jgi:hypothetical protein
MARPKKTAVTAAPPEPTSAPLAAPSVDHEEDVRAAFQMALLAQLQAPEVSASVLDVCRKWLADRETARQWAVDRADLEIQADKSEPKPLQITSTTLPFLPGGKPNPLHRPRFETE